MKTSNRLVDVADAVKLIENKKTLVIAGEEDVLKQLPKGNWIGGTIPYFMDTNGGCFSKSKVFVTDLTGLIAEFKIEAYNSEELPSFINNQYKNGFTYVLIPAFSEIHTRYSIDVYSIADLYNQPIFGWITGIDLNDFGKKSPKVFNGNTLETIDNKAIMLHASLPDNKYAKLEIINLFNQGNGDTITFPETGFQSSDCIINGKKENLAKYISTRNIDTRLPLVADYSGASINISIQNIDKTKNTVDYYAPAQSGVEYKFAHPISNYIAEFTKSLPSDESGIVTSCNCILNYLYSELEGKKTGNIAGPITFGEIAYVLVNQTLVYLSIENR
jgi:hypothetical protein